MLLDVAWNHHRRIPLLASLHVPGERFPMPVVNPRALRCRLYRAVRLVVLRAIDSGLAEVVARGLVLLGSRSGLALLGQIAVIRNRHDDQTLFWERALSLRPGEPLFMRGEIDAALRSGKIDIAEQEFVRLVASRKAGYTDWSFVVGLSHVDQCRGERYAIRVRVRAFLKSLRGKPDYRIAAIKLSRLIFAHFPPDGQSGVGVDHYNSRFLRMLGHSHIRSSPRKLLERVAACESRLSAAGTTIFDTDISPVQCRRFIAVVRQRLASRTPFSFVRIGDGEAACLPYEPALTPMARIDAADRERIWWGRPLRPVIRRRMAQKIAGAMWDADCIGIPTTSRFLREIELTKEDRLENKLTGRGLRAILYNVERYREFRPDGGPPIFTSCHLHQDLERWNLYAELFDSAKNVVLVSCHPGLADWMTKKFAIGVTGNILLPPDHVSGPLLGRRLSEGRELPEMLDETIGRVAALSAHSLVLVGAGYPGKILVEAARTHGGVALDLGSIFDYWLGISTRSYLDLRPA